MTANVGTVNPDFRQVVYSLKMQDNSLALILLRDIKRSVIPYEWMVLLSADPAGLRLISKGHRDLQFTAKIILPPITLTCIVIVKPETPLPEYGYALRAFRIPGEG